MKELLKTVNQLWPFMKPFKRQLFWILFSGVLMAAMAWIPIELVNRLYHAFEDKDLQASQWLPFAFPVVFGILGAIRYVHVRVTKVTTELVLASIRRKMLEQFVKLNLTFHNSFGAGSGGLLSRVINDTSLLQEGLFFIVAILREPILIAVFFFKMVSLNWQLTLFSFVMAPVFITLMRTISKSLKKYGHLNRAAMDEVTSTLKESLDGVRVIQSFNLEGRIIERFDANQKDYVQTRADIISREEAVSPINEMMGSLAFMGFAIVAFHQIFGGTSSPAEFTAFIMAAGLLQPPVKNFQTSMVKLQQTYIVMDRLFKLIDDPNRVPEIANPKPFPKNWKYIRFENVSFAYGSEMVLKNVNLEIKRGEVCALVGESGSGKSTLVNLLERFFDPTSGRILLDDTPINEIGLNDLRHHIALVTQDVFLFRDSIERNIQAGDFSKTLEGVPGAAKSANAHTFIEAMPHGYQSSVGERGGLLSGGERQRVSIARAIFKDAPILILDEATSALDSVSELEVQKGLNHLMEGRTAFVIAHRLSTVFNADRIVVMRKGELVEQGTHKELLTRKGEYFNFYSLQMNHAERDVLTRA